MNIYADTVIINEGGNSFPGNLVITDPIPSLGLSYNELNAAVKAGRDVIVVLHNGGPDDVFEVFRLSRYAFEDGKYFASFWGGCGHLEYTATGPDVAFESYPM